MVTALDSLLYPKAGSRTCHHAIAGIPAIWCFWRWWWQWCGGGREIRLSRLLPSQVAAVIVSIEIFDLFRLGEIVVQKNGGKPAMEMQRRGVQQQGLAVWVPVRHLWKCVQHGACADASSNTVLYCNLMQTS